MVPRNRPFPPPTSGGGGRTHSLPASVIWPLTAHPLRNGAGGLTALPANHAPQSPLTRRMQCHPPNESPAVWPPRTVDPQSTTFAHVPASSACSCKPRSQSINVFGAPLVSMRPAGRGFHNIQARMVAGHDGFFVVVSREGTANLPGSHKIAQGEGTPTSLYAVPP